MRNSTTVRLHLKQIVSLDCLGDLTVCVVTNGAIDASHSIVDVQEVYWHHVSVINGLNSRFKVWVYRTSLISHHHRKLSENNFRAVSSTIKRFVLGNQKSLFKRFKRLTSKRHSSIVGSRAFSAASIVSTYCQFVRKCVHPRPPQAEPISGRSRKAKS